MNIFDLYNDVSLEDIRRSAYRFHIKAEMSAMQKETIESTREYAKSLGTTQRFTNKEKVEILREMRDAAAKPYDVVIAEIEAKIK